MADTKNVVRTGWEQIEQQEKATSGTVTAGHLVEVSGGAVQPHSTDGGNVDTPKFAKDMRGRGYEAGDDYPAGEFITYLLCNGSALITALLAPDNTVSADDETRLVSNGDGTLRVFNSGGGDVEGDVVAVAKETLDTSGDAEPSLVEIEVTA